MTTRPRVLLADDYLPLLTALGRLIHLECEVIGAVTTVKELLEVAQATRPDLAIIDLSFPDASGIDACRQLKLVQPGLEIIMLTAMSDASVRAAALQAGVASFVPKGMIHTQLLPAIRDIWSKTGTPR